MSKFNEILNSSNPSDALLGEQIDALSEEIKSVKDSFVYHGLAGSPLSLSLEDGKMYLMVLQTGTSSTIWSLYLTSNTIKSSKIDTNTFNGANIAVNGNVLTITPTTWIFVGVFCLGKNS